MKAIDKKKRIKDWTQKIKDRMGKFVTPEVTFICSLAGVMVNFAIAAVTFRAHIAVNHVIWGSIWLGMMIRVAMDMYQERNGKDG